MAISNSAGGKGSAMRPSSVSREEYGNNHDMIFGSKKKNQDSAFIDIQHLLSKLNINQDQFTKNPTNGFIEEINNIKFVFLRSKWILLSDTALSSISAAVNTTPVIPSIGDTYTSLSESKIFTMTENGWVEDGSL